MAGVARAVLVVDDDRDLREMVELTLNGMGYRVLMAANGWEALEQVAHEMPGVILLDMKMPGMDGWAFAREFQARYDRLAPIVVLTAAPDARQRAAEIGAEGYLGKPFELDELFRAVERHVGGGDFPDAGTR